MVSVTASYYPKTFAFEASKLLPDICLASSRILYFWYVLKSIHNFILDLHALQLLFVRGSNKKQRRGRIISNFTKGETFFISYDNQVLLKCAPTSCALPRKVFLSPSVWERRESIRKLNWKESLLVCFENCQGVPCSHWQSRIWWWILL